MPFYAAGPLKMNKYKKKKLSYFSSSDDIYTCLDELTNGKH